MPLFFLPQALFGLHSLHILGLSDNELTVLPSAVSNLTNLREVDISKNGEQFTALPRAYVRIERYLKILLSCHLYRSDGLIFIFFEGIIDLPESVKNCKCLEQFDASVNPIGK